MPPKGSSPRTLDLFEVTLTIPTPQPAPTSAATKLPAFAGQSDAELAQQLGRLLEEMRRRLKGRGRRPELEAVASQASLSLKSSVPSHAKQGRPSRPSRASFPLQEGQRKAVRAAVLAGVAPTQVAKHFGLSLAAVRKALEEPA